MADPIAKLGGMVAGAVFTIITGSREGASFCSGLCEWTIQRLKGTSPAATLGSLSQDISRDLLAHLERGGHVPGSSGASEPEPIIDNAFEAISMGPTLDEIIRDHRQVPENVAAAVFPLLAKRFSQTDDPVRPRAESLIRLFYERLFHHPKFPELSESSFRQVVLSESKIVRNQLLRILDGTENIEQILLGIPRETSASLRHIASSYLLDPQRALWAPIAGFSTGADLSLLHPKYRIIEIERREQELADIASWCEEKSAIDLRLYTGAGGTGKTRLMIEACERQWRLAGWRAGFVRRTKELNRDILYRALLEDERPLLAVFDYAELQISEIRTFLSAAITCARNTSRKTTIRVVLLSREAGDWWNNELPAGNDEIPAFFATISAKPSLVQHLSPIAESRADRFKLFARWRSAFRIQLGRKGSDDVLPAWRQLLGQAGMERGLFIALAALAATDAEDGSVPTSIEAMLRFTINRERARWMELATGYDSSLVFDGLVFATLNMGLSDRATAGRALRLIPSFDGQRQIDIDRVVEALHVQYPGDGSQWIAPLQPDLIGEFLVALRFKDDDMIVDRALGCVELPSLPYACLTILTRMARSWESISWVSKQARDALSVLLERNFSILAEASIDTALLTGDPVGQIAAKILAVSASSHLAQRVLAHALPRVDSGRIDVVALREILAEASLIVHRELISTSSEDEAEHKAKRALSAGNIGVLLSRLDRREEALAATQEAADLYRALAGKHPQVFTPNLAGSINNLASMLSDLNRRDEALASAQEAADLYRALSDSHPEVFVPDLAGSLNNLANVLSGLNRREEALAAAQEAADLYRALASNRPEVFTPDLAMSLNNLANRLSDLNRREEALTAAQEAADLYRAQAGTRPEVFTPDLAMSLNNLASKLGALDRREEALATAQEAVNLYRALAGNRPEVFTSDLAGSLNNLAGMLSALDRREEALAAAQETADLYRALAGNRPEVFTPDLAMSFNNLANMLSALSRREEALAAAQEAVDLRRGLARTHPKVFTSDLAMSINTLANRLSALNRHEEALTAAQEAVDLRRGLARTHPEVFTPDLAGSLNNLANRLSALNRPVEALAAAQEAADFYRALAGNRPEVITPHLAMSLNTLANRLSALNRPEEALAAAQEAIGLYRALASNRPGVFTPNLAISLNNLAGVLSALDRREEALAAAQEAIDLYRALAGNRPDVFTPDLAGSLNNLANRLSDLDRREEALAAAQEAVNLHRALAGTSPEVLTPKLAMSLGMLGSLAKAANKPNESLLAFKEGIQCLLPYFQSSQSEYGPTMLKLAQDYVQACEIMAAEPEKELLGLISKYGLLLPRTAEDQG